MLAVFKGWEGNKAGLFVSQYSVSGTVIDGLFDQRRMTAELSELTAGMVVRCHRFPRRNSGHGKKCLKLEGMADNLSVPSRCDND